MAEACITWVYELHDGSPVSSILHQPDNLGTALQLNGFRVPFGDVTRNFAEYYAPFIEADSLKSPDRKKSCSSRFSPNQPPGMGAAKRLLWSKGLPPLARPTDGQGQPSHVFNTSGFDQLERDGSPTRHAHSPSCSVKARAVGAPQGLSSLGGRDSNAHLVSTHIITDVNTVSPSLAQMGFFPAEQTTESLAARLGRVGTPPFPSPTPSLMTCVGPSVQMAEAEASTIISFADENAVSHPLERINISSVVGILRGAAPKLAYNI